jgi:hypothetical protein
MPLGLCLKHLSISSSQRFHVATRVHGVLIWAASIETMLFGYIDWSYDIWKFTVSCFWRHCKDLASFLATDRPEYLCECQRTEGAPSENDAESSESHQLMTRLQADDIATTFSEPSALGKNPIRTNNTTECPVCGHHQWYLDSAKNTIKLKLTDVALSLLLRGRSIPLHAQMLNNSTVCNKVF